MTIKDTLSRLRSERGMTQEELAAKLFVTRQAVSRWETGETEPSIAMTKKLADALNMPVSALLSALEYENDPYEAEARQHYGNDVVDASYAQLKNLSPDEQSALSLLEESIKVQLRLAMKSGSPTSPESAELAHMHTRWIKMHWGSTYTAQAHLGLAHGYLADQRFVDYYDSACGSGATAFLVEALTANIPQ